MRELAVEMMGEFAVPASLIVVGGNFDAMAGKKDRTNQVVPCLAVMSIRRVAATNGVIVTQSVITMNVAPKTGDKVKLGPNTYTVETFEVIAPDGNPILWKAVVK